MRKVTLGLLGLACVAALTLNGLGQQSSNQSVADDVIAVVKAQWAAEMKDPTNVAEQMKNIADDYTEFNGDYATQAWPAEGQHKGKQEMKRGGKFSPRKRVAFHE